MNHDDWMDDTDEQRYLARHERIRMIMLILPVILSCISIILLIPYLVKDKDTATNPIVSEDGFELKELDKVEIPEQPEGLGIVLDYDPKEDEEYKSGLTNSGGVGQLDFSDATVIQTVNLPSNIKNNYGEDVATQFVDTVVQKEPKVYTCSISWYKTIDTDQFNTLSALTGQIYQDYLNDGNDGNFIVETRMATFTELQEADIPYNFYIDDNGSLVIFIVVTVKDNEKKTKVSELKTFTIRYVGNVLKVEGYN